MRIFFLWSTILLQVAFLSLPLTSNALEPMDDAEMDGVHAQSGIVLGLSDAEIYTHKGYETYQDTTSSGTMIEFEDTSSFHRFNTPEGIFLRVFQNDSGLPLVALEALSDIYDDAWVQDMALYTGAITFDGENLGALEVKGMGPKEFALYMTPAGVIDNLPANSGVTFQLEARASMDEFRWDYRGNGSEDGQFLLGGGEVAGSFDEQGNPDGRFIIGNLDPRDENAGALAPAMFRVMQDDDGRGFVRMNLPMEGSIRIDDIEMGEHDVYGPLHVDGMEIHHLQMDFAP